MQQIADNATLWNVSHTNNISLFIIHRKVCGSELINVVHRPIKNKVYTS